MGLFLRWGIKVFDLFFLNKLIQCNKLIDNNLKNSDIRIR